MHIPIRKFLLGWPIRAGLCSLGAAVALTVATSPSEAAMVRATFEVLASFNGSAVEASALPSRYYVIDFDIDRVGTYQTLDGVTHLVPDDAAARHFYVELVQGNYVSEGLGGGRNAAEMNFASWMAGTAGYPTRTRVSLATESDVDMVQIDGFWEYVNPLVDEQSFLADGATWSIVDFAQRASGTSYQGYFSAALVSLVAVPEPASLYLALAALGLMFSARRVRVVPRRH